MSRKMQLAYINEELILKSIDYIIIIMYLWLVSISKIYSSNRCKPD